MQSKMKKKKRKVTIDREKFTFLAHGGRLLLTGVLLSAYESGMDPSFEVGHRRPVNDDNGGNSGGDRGNSLF